MSDDSRTKWGQSGGFTNGKKRSDRPRQFSLTWDWTSASTSIEQRTCGTSWKYSSAVVQLSKVLYLILSAVRRSALCFSTREGRELERVFSHRLCSLTRGRAAGEEGVNLVGVALATGRLPLGRNC